MEGKSEQLNEDFVNILQKIEKKLCFFSKHQQIRIEKWVEKLIQQDETYQWQKNRNNYMMLLEAMVQNGKIQDPFDKMPPSNLKSMNDSELNYNLQIIGTAKLKETRSKNNKENIQSGYSKFMSSELMSESDKNLFNYPNSLSAISLNSPK